MNQLSLALPPVLRLHRLPVRGALMAAAISFGLVFGGLIERLPLWGIALAALLPWLPIWWLETAWQSKHYGLYGFFGALTLFQLGHMMEHTAELVQLFFNHGDLTQSHGVFGLLDNETVHFYWNLGVWLGTVVLLRRFGSRNPWLWVAFIAASVHMVEHVYLYWLYVFHQEFYAAGGWAGILGEGGIIGLPLARPYLHFVYNYFEVVPLVIAFWDQGWLVYDHYLERAFPSLSERALLTITARLQRMTMVAGSAIIGQAAGTDRCYIVSKGEVEVISEDETGRRSTSMLGPGQFFEIRGRVHGRSRVVSARAGRATELLALDREALAELTNRSEEIAS